MVVLEDLNIIRQLPEYRRQAISQSLEEPFSGNQEDAVSSLLVIE